MKGISVVVPIYNEEDNVVLSYKEIKQVLESTGELYEIIFVDDGSRDETRERIKNEARGDAHFVLVEFRRNFGQTAAMAAGFQMSRYNIVVALDGDLQNDPAEIPKMIEKLEQGYDLVAGWRKDRKDKYLSRRLPSNIANWLISKATDVSLHDYGCTLKVMTGDVARGIKLFGEMHRFIPALAAEMGARIVEVPVNHRPRRFGTTKYGISRTFRVFLDLILIKFLLGYSKRPIHLFGSLGLLTGGLGGLILGVMTFQKLAYSISMGSRPLLMLGVMLVIIGLQFLVFGLLAEVLARTYYESQDKPIYVVRRVLRFSDNVLTTQEDDKSQPPIRNEVNT